MLLPSSWACSSEWFASGARDALRPLDLQVATHRKKLRRMHPEHRRLDRGPLRGIKVSQLEEFHDFFRSFIHGRTMHFVVSNIISPRSWLAQCALTGSLATIGAHRFRTLSQLLSTMLSGRMLGTGVWICSFANNQHRKGIEIGDD